MGQNLTHGIYLPDEGERNCYNGLASNWSILDGAVGTVAEHSTQISGKAPLVHTHSKADITDFPAYGTTAGTICEGNDSRLSDARTPVAHTHSKADVTDLFNSANTWSGDNTFSKAVGFTKVNATTLYAQNSRVELGDSGLSGDSYNQISFWDKNNDNLSYLRQTYTTDGTNAFNIFVRNKFLNGVPNTAGTVDYAYFGLTLNADKSKEGILKASFRPYDNNTYDLGSSSYQWNNLYAKNYYYNGTAWGLDKINTWSNVNKFTSIIQLQYLQSGEYSDIRFSNENNVNECVIRNYTGNITIGKKYQSASAWFNGPQIILTDNGTVQIKSYDGTESWTVNFAPVGVYPTSNNALELGTSTNKWKSFNGINPGALSLPDCQVTQSIDRTGWVYDGATYNTVLLATTDTNMTKNGWLYVRMANTTSSDKLTIKYNSTTDRYPTNTFGDVGGCIEVFVPVVADTNIYVLATKDLSFCKFYPCLGNVPSGV